jgi:hypothetical protein
MQPGGQSTPTRLVDEKRQFHSRLP